MRLAMTSGWASRWCTRAAWNVGKDVNGWAIQQKNLNQRLSEMRGEADKLMITLGTQLLPPLTAVMGFMADHQGVVKALAVGIGTVLVAATAAWTVRLVAAGAGVIKLVGANLAFKEGTYTLAAAQKIAAIAQWDLNAAMAANPVGAVILTLVAFAAAIKLAYDHFKPFHDAWDRGWKQWGEAFSFAADIFRRGWKQITDGLDSAWHGIQGFGRNVVDVFGTIWSALTGGKKAQDDILGFFSRLPGDIGKALGQAGGVLADFGSKIPGWIMSGISVVGDFGKKLLDRITSGLSTGAKQLADFGGKIPGWLWDGIKTAVNLGVRFVDGLLECERLGGRLGNFSAAAPDRLGAERCRGSAWLRGLWWRSRRAVPPGRDPSGHASGRSTLLSVDAG